MKIHTSYSVRIQGYSAVLDRTVALDRSAVDFFIDVMLRNWQQFDGLKQTEFVKLTEVPCIKTAKRPVVAYDFSADFYNSRQISTNSLHTFVEQRSLRLSALFLPTKPVWLNGK